MADDDYRNLVDGSESGDGGCHLDLTRLWPEEPIAAAEWTLRFRHVAESGVLEYYQPRLMLSQTNDNIGTRRIFSSG